MASFTVTLFPEGDPVQVTDGPYKGKTGKIHGWLRVAPESTDVVHVIKLDQPIEVAANVRERSDGVLIKELPHRIEQIEVKASWLAFTPASA